MLLSISNIAWQKEHDGEMYAFLSENGFDGLEIAPTRLFPADPYRHILQARQFSSRLRNEYGLRISSMQSIWYGRTENIFGTQSERETLIEYTKHAIEFAAAMECGNLVFGCPKNRNIPDGLSDFESIALDFFSKLSEYAKANETVIALEPNPPVYGTNFINTTKQALSLCKTLAAEGLRVNADTGALISGGEPLSLIADNISLINHIHISEPGLAPIGHREIHSSILSLTFDKYVSIEMGDCGDISKVKQVTQYIKKEAKR